MEEVLRKAHQTLLEARRAYALVSSSRFSEAWEAATEEQRAALDKLDTKSVETWIASIKIKIDYKAWAVANRIPHASRLNVSILRSMYEQQKRRPESSVSGSNQIEARDVEADVGLCRPNAGDAEHRSGFTYIASSRKVARQLLKDKYSLYDCVHSAAHWRSVLGKPESNRNP